MFTALNNISVSQKHIVPSNVANKGHSTFFMSTTVKGARLRDLKIHVSGKDSQMLIVAVLSQAQQCVVNNILRIILFLNYETVQLQLSITNMTMGARNLSKPRLNVSEY